MFFGGLDQWVLPWEDIQEKVSKVTLTHDQRMSIVIGGISKISTRITMIQFQLVKDRDSLTDLQYEELWRKMARFNRSIKKLTLYGKKFCSHSFVFSKCAIETEQDYYKCKYCQQEWYTDCIDQLRRSVNPEYPSAELVRSAY